jgi:hypothetical protein
MYVTIIFRNTIVTTTILMKTMEYITDKLLYFREDFEEASCYNYDC